MTRDENVFATDKIVIHNREEELEVLERVKALDEALNDFCWSGLYRIIDNRTLRDLHMLLRDTIQNLEADMVDDIIVEDDPNSDVYNPIEKLVKVEKVYPYNLYTIRN